MDSFPWGLSTRIDKASAALGFLTGFYCSGAKAEAAEPMQGLKELPRAPGKTGHNQEVFVCQDPVLLVWGRGG